MKTHHFILAIVAMLCGAYIMRDVPKMAFNNRDAAVDAAILPKPQPQSNASRIACQLFHDHSKDKKPIPRNTTRNSIPSYKPVYYKSVNTGLCFVAFYNQAEACTLVPCDSLKNVEIKLMQ